MSQEKLGKPKTKRGPAKGTGGRPPAKIDWAKVDALCRFHAPANDIADVFSSIDKDVSYDTLDRRAAEEHGVTFAEYVEQKRASLCRNRLRELQWDSAVKGNVTMQIWLGKQYLGQTDKSDTKIDGGLTIEIVKYAGQSTK